MTKLSNGSPDEQKQEVSVACHVHSDWSYDGKWSLPDLAHAFGRRGYRVVMMTEHDRGFDEARWTSYRAACSGASSEKILFVPGIEYSDPANVIHVLVWGCPLFLGESLSTSFLLEAVRTNQALAVLAHPSRRDAWQVFDPSWAGSLLGIELWNRKTDGWARSRAAAKLLSATGLSPFVGLDFHESNQFFPMAMKLKIPNALSEESVIDSLRGRNFSAIAFGRPIDSFSRGLPSPILEVAEFCRRRAAPIYRSLRSN